MTKVIDKLTLEQEQLLEVVRQEWVNRLTYDESIFSMEKVKAAVDIIYKAHKLKPASEIIVVRSYSEMRFQYQKLQLKYPELSIDNTDIYSYCSGYGSSADWEWTAFYDFFARCGEEVDPEYSDLYAIAQAQIYDYLLFDELIIVLLPFKKITFQDKTFNKIHSAKEAAVETLDGKKAYFLENVQFNEDLFYKIVNKKLTLKEVFKIKNVEQRMLAIKYSGGMVTFLSQTKHDVIHTSVRGNKLYLVNDVFSKPEYFVEVKCMSTGRKYLKYVPESQIPNKNADEATAVHFNWSGTEYAQLTQES